MASFDMMGIKLLADEEYLTTAYGEIFGQRTGGGDLSAYLDLLYKGMPRERVVFEMKMSKEASVYARDLRGLRLKSIGVNDLLKFDGKQFIDACYLAILGRSADETGMNDTYSAYIKGDISREEIIYNLKASGEGQKNGVLIEGFEAIAKKRKIRKLIFHIPLIGKIAKNSYIKKNFNRVVNIRLEELSTALENNEKRTRIAEDKLRVYETMYASYLSDIEVRENENQLPAGMDAIKLYENVAGNGEEQRMQFSVYDEIMTKLASNDGKLYGLDLACGKGEWIEYCTEKFGASFIGLEDNDALVSYCKDKNVNVIKADSLKYIESVSGESMDVISMFHLAERMDMQELSRTIFECSRVLREGGSLLIETISPAGVNRQLQGFYSDPRNKRIYSADLLKNVLEGAGFSGIKTIQSINVSNNILVAYKKDAK